MIRCGRLRETPVLRAREHLSPDIRGTPLHHANRAPPESENYQAAEEAKYKPDRLGHGFTMLENSLLRKGLEGNSSLTGKRQLLQTSEVSKNTPFRYPENL